MSRGARGGAALRAVVAAAAAAAAVPTAAAAIGKEDVGAAAMMEKVACLPVVGREGLEGAAAPGATAIAGIASV